MRIDLDRVLRLAQEDPEIDDDTESQLDAAIEAASGGAASADEEDPFAGIGDEDTEDAEGGAASADEEDPALEEPLPGEEEPPQEGGEEEKAEELEPPPPRTLVFDKSIPGKNPEVDKEPSDSWDYEDNLNSPMSRWLGGSDQERFAGMYPEEIFFD